MKRSQRIEQITKITKGQEEEFARALADCQQRYLAQQKQLQDLQLYFQQYSQEITQIAGGGLDIKRYQNMQLFLGNLTQAIEQQKNIVAQVGKEYEHKKKLWLEKRNRNKAMDSIGDRYRVQEEIQEEKKLQRDIDDRSSRQGGGKA